MNLISYPFQSSFCTVEINVEVISFGADVVVGSAVRVAGVLVAGVSAAEVVDVGCFSISIIFSKLETSCSRSSTVVVVDDSVDVVVSSAVVEVTGDCSSPADISFLRSC